MVKQDVQVLIKARDQASAAFRKTGKSVTGLTSTLKKAAAAAATYFGARALARFARSSLEAYAAQEAAVNHLDAALKILGKSGEDTMADMQKFASSIQEVTTVGDEAVLELMALGSSMGKLSGEALKDATKAAIGLSKAFGMDAVAAMRLVARAAQGDTSSLSRYGIKLDATLSIQEKFNAVLKIGASNFVLAEAETETFAGQMKQLSNSLGDLTEKVGEALVPMVKKLAGHLQGLTIDSVKSMAKFAKWTASIALGAILAPKLIAAIMGIRRALQALATAQTITQALSGPAGWATLAAGIGIATVAVVGLDQAFGSLNTEMVSFNTGLAKAESDLAKLGTVALDLQIEKAAMTPGAWGDMVKKLKAKFGTPKQDEAGVSGISSFFAQTAAEKSIWRQTRALQEQIRTFGKSKEQLHLMEAAQAGVNKQKLEWIESLYAEKRALEQQQSAQETAQESFKSFTAEMTRRIATAGMTALETQLFDLKEAGVKGQQLLDAARLAQSVAMAEAPAMAEDEPDQRMTDFAQRGRASVAAEESRFLTLGGGRNFPEMTEKNTRKTVDILTQLDEKTGELVAQGRNPTNNFATSSLN